MAISVVTQDQVQAQGAVTVPQAIRYTSGTTVEQTGADLRFDNIYIRGFLADQYLDSLKLIQGSWAQTIVEPYNLERIEVLHGPSSVLYGQASPGGIVDMVSKMPTVDPYREMFLTTGSYGRIQGGVDVSGPIDKDKQFLYRLTASGFDVGSQVDDTRYQRVSIAPSLTWRPDNDTSITFLGTYQRDPKAGFFNQLPLGGAGTLFPLVTGYKIPTSFYPGEPSYDKMDRTLASVGYKFEHRFESGWTVRQNLRYRENDADVAVVSPLGTIDASGNMSRSAFTEQETLKTFSVDNQAEAKFNAGPFQHTALFGIDYQHGTDRVQSTYGTTGVAAINVYNPVYNVAIPQQPLLANSLQTFNQLGFYAQDQIKLGNWVALLGLRQDESDTTTNNFKTSKTTSQTDHAFTKRAALLYKFDNGVAPYVQYTESFQPVVGTDFYGNPYRPTTGQQEEVGIKFQPNPKTLLSAAVFNLTQQNVQTPDPSNSLNTIQTGEIRSRGVELEGKSEVTPNLTVLASYTHLDLAVTATNTAGTLGKRPVGIPDNTASVWADYTFHSGPLDGFGLAGGVRYLGESAGNTTNTYSVPATTLVDAALHYDLAGLSRQLKGFKMSVNATNLFDRTYVQWCQNFGCYYGLRRQVLATLRYQW
ncbi:MAG: TonB-dependent siderophore receptor [Bradyrhizobium sp.]